MGAVSHRLRTLRTFARAAACRRSVLLDDRQVDVLGLSFEGRRWVVAVADHETSSLRIVDADQARRVELTRSKAGFPRPDFDGHEFAWCSWLQSGGGTGDTAIWVDEDALDIVGHALPVRRIAPAGSGLWEARIRTSDSTRLEQLAASLAPCAAVHSPSMSARARTSSKAKTAEARLLALASWLLEQSEPVSRKQIFSEFPDEYTGKADAVEKKFSRDKDALRKLGYAIETVELGDAEEPIGYVLSPRSCRLPNLSLSPDEAALIWSAGTGAARLANHPLQEDLESALRKLVVGAQGVPPRAAALEELVSEPPALRQEQLLRRLVDAWEHRKRITIDYWRVSSNQVVTRDVDVYGWASRRGEWIFVGHCSIRKSPRIFYLSRVRKLTVNTVRLQDPDYAIPKGFDIRRWSRQQTWEYDVHPPRSVTVRFRGSLARVARTLVPGAATSTDVEGSRIVRFEVRNLFGLVRQVLAWGPEAELVEPPEGRTMAHEVLVRVCREPERRPV